MTEVSDIVDELSTTTPLLAGQTFTSKIINVGLYRSINISSISDKRGEVAIHFSATGKPGTFDIRKSWRTYPNSTYQYVYKVENLWCYTTFRNIDSTDETYRRSFSFAGAIFESNSKNDGFTEVYNLSVDGSGQTVVSQASDKIPYCQYHTSIIPRQAKTNVAVNPFPWNVLSYVTQSNLADVNIVYQTGDFLRLYSPPIVGFSRTISKLVYPSSRDKIIMFQMDVEYGNPAVYANTYNMIGYGIPIAGNNRGFYNGIFVTSGGASKIGIAYWKNGVETKIPQTSFNVDTLEGTQKSHKCEIDKLNAFRIDISNIGEIIFYIFNPVYKYWNMFHRLFDISFSEEPAFTNNNGFMVVQSECLNPSVEDYITLYSLTMNIYEPISRSLQRTFSTSRSITSTDEQIAVLSTSSTQPWTTTSGIYPSHIKLKSIELVNISSSVIQFTMYKDCTVAATVFTQGSKSNITYSFPGGARATSQYFKTYFVGPNQTQVIKLDTEINWEEILTLNARLLTNDISSTLYYTIFFEEYF